MNISVDKNIRTPLYWQISDQIKEMILRGQLVDGAILPSERAMATRIGVHRNTVIKAYSELKDEGYVSSRPGVGYLITHKVEEAVEGPSKKVNWDALIKEEYQSTEHTFDDIFQRFKEEQYISFSTGMPPSVYREDEIGDDFSKILNEEGHRPFYLSPYQGDIKLRQEFVSYLRTKGINTSIGHVQVMSETNQALDFIVESILQPGDCVITEEPVSPDVFRIIKLAKCDVITVPVDEDGMICDMLEGLIEKHNPKLIYVSSSYQDPTGNIMSIERRKKVLEISNRYRLPIIEEDAASELSFDNKSMPTIKSMDRNDNVIYIYSFEMTFIPGLSLALVVASEKLIKSLSYLVSIRIMSLDWITQKLVYKYMADGRYYERVKEIGAINKSKMELMCSYLDCAKEHGLSYVKPKGGVYVWCRLPDGIDNREIVASGSKRGISMIPGEVFFPNKNGGQNYIRLNYSYESISRIKKGMDIFLQIIEELV